MRLRKASSKSVMANWNKTLDVNRTLQYTRWLLEALGVWTMLKTNPGKWEVFGSKIVIIVCWVLIAFITVPCTMHMIFIETNPLAKLMVFGPIGFCLTNIVKYCSIIHRRGVLKRCMEHVEIDWMEIETEKDREIMTRNVNVGRNLTLLCTSFMYTGGLSYNAIMPLWRGSHLDALNRTIRPLAYPGYDIFVDSQASPTYEILFYTNCLAACVTFTITITACNLAATFVAHVCGQIEIMMGRMDDLFDGIDESSDIAETRLSFVVKSHVRVLRLTAMIETMLREICLVEVVASTLIICLLEYYCLTEWNNSDGIAITTYVVLLVSFSFNIFIFCHIGELLMQQCSRVGNAAYMAEWYRLRYKTGRALLMIIAMANSPRKLTAGGMLDLSLYSFGTILKTSVVYLNVIRTTTN